MKNRNFRESVLKNDKLGLFIALIAISVLFSSLSPYFFTYKNLINILIAASLVGLVAIGESYLVIAGYVDLSAGSVAAFSGVLTSILLLNGYNTATTLLIVIVCGALIGVINASMVNYLRLESFIATLATMSIFRGFAYILCEGKPVFISNRTFLKIGVDRIFGVPIPIIILLIAFIIFGIVLKNTTFGRNIYIIGGNKTAARLAGINPRKVTLIAFMINASLAALGGAILASRMTSGQPAASVGLEFDAITAAVLGGIAFSGGVGTIFGTFLGVLILQGFNNGLLIMNVPSFWQQVARGLLLIAALMFDYIRTKNRK
ncbi:MAG: ABC transporter permease [Vallitaleaceae bacterium]|nr:ABC transporter permease [Vallitaleaceae bacterium]